MANTIINATLAAGSAASPYFYDVGITHTLCRKTCATSAPVFAPAFSVASFYAVGNGQYEAVVNVSGVVSYVPCSSGCSCAMKSELVAGSFVVPFVSATAPEGVTITAGTTRTSVVTSGCKRCGSTMQSATTIDIAILTT